MNPFIDILQSSFSVLLHTVAGFLPNLIVAFALVALGIVVGVSFEKIIARIVRLLKLDEFLESAGIRAFLFRARVRLDAGLFFGGLVKWFIVIAFLTAGLQAVGLTQVNAFLGTIILAYIPQVIIVVLMLLFASVGARATKTAVTASARTLDPSVANFLGATASTAIWIGTIIFVLSQLGIASDFMKILFIGIVGMFSLAFGLAFGLGGKEEAGLLLTKMRKDLTHRQ